MDIQGWLLGTADRAPPDPSDRLETPAFIQPARDIKATAATGHRRKRHRDSSDSFIIAPQQRASHRGKVGSHSGRAGKDRHVSRPVSRSDSARRHHPRSESSQHRIQHGRIQQSAPKTYERRARHKTKPDRYAPIPRKKHGDEQRDHSGGRKAKKKRDRSHRAHDGKRTEDLVQGFRLKNGPSNSRLTLKPDAGAGLFKHGRTSAQVAGRSNGLPDLAFNELKFLRDSKEHQDEDQHRQSKRKPSNQEKLRQLEREEISAYFNDHGDYEKTRELSPIKHAEGKRSRLARDDTPPEQSDAQEKGSSPVLPDAELTANPYLGFGSKGTIKQSSNPQPSATSYLIWSESVAGPVPPKKGVPRVQTTLQAGQLSAPRPKHTLRSRHEPAAAKPSEKTVKRNNYHDPQDSSKGQWTKSRRTRGSAHVEVYEAPELDPFADARKPHESTSQSLPEVQSAVTRQLPHKVDVRQQEPSSGVESFRTSDILRVRQRLQNLAEQPPPGLKSGQAHRADVEKENVNPVSSSPTAKVLRLAHEAMLQNHRDAIAEPPIVINQYEEADSEWNVNPSVPPMPSHHQTHQLHWRDLDQSQYAQPVARSSPSLVGHYIDQQTFHDMQAVQECLAQDDKDMLDVASPPAPQNISIADMADGHHSAYVHTPAARYIGMRSFSQANERPSTHAREIPWSRDGISTLRGTSSHNTFAVQATLATEDRMGNHDFEDGLEGFWRPRRLY